MILPGIRDRHVGIIEREDGMWAVRGDGTARVNGVDVGEGMRLSAGDIIELSGGCRFRYGEPPAVPVSPTPRQEPRAKPRRPSRLRQGIHVSKRVVVMTTLGAALLGGAMWAFWTALRSPTSGQELTLEQEVTLDSLLREAYDRIERGTAMLEIGASEAALKDFADGILVLQQHPLHRHPAVNPRILAMEAAVAAIYREKRVAVPRAYADARGGSGLAGAGLSASLSVSLFAQRFAEVRARFELRYGRAIRVTGSDHAEHLSLYGQSSALDLGTKELEPDQVDFLVRELKGAGIRVKDFSSDAVLKRQVQAAIQAGLPDRAGTAVHLHIDRFGGRRDRWTS